MRCRKNARFRGRTQAVILKTNKTLSPARKRVLSFASKPLSLCYDNFLKITVALCPPNPNVLLKAKLIWRSFAWLNVKSILGSTSGSSSNWLIVGGTMLFCIAKIEAILSTAPAVQVTSWKRQLSLGREKQGNIWKGLRKKLSARYKNVYRVNSG